VLLPGVGQPRGRLRRGGGGAGGPEEWGGGGVMLRAPGRGGDGTQMGERRRV